jgi:hypothetical protein
MTNTHMPDQGFIDAKTPMVFTKIEELEKEIEMLQEAIGFLDKHLSPLMFPAPKLEKPPPKESEKLSPLAARLDHMIDSISVLREIMKSYLDNLQI